MKTYILALVALALVFLNHSKAQEGEKYRVFYPFKVSAPQSIQGKYAPYNILYDTSPLGFNTAYIYKQSNQLCMYEPKFLAIDHHGDMWLQVNNQDILFRILYKHMASYFHGRDNGSILCNLYSKLDSKVHEIMFEAPIKDAKRIPLEAFERLEAEIMLSGVRVDFNKSPDLLNGGDWVSGKFGCVGEDLRDYNKTKEARHYGEEMPIVINKRRISPDREELIRKIFRYAYREMWDTAKFRYFTPEIMCRLIFDVERGAEYFNTRELSYFHKKGERSNLLLPMDKRAKFSTATDNRAYSTEYAVYQILYDEETYRSMSDAEFVVETLVRLMQTYISYELMIEAYLAPKVKAHLTEQDWFMGNFSQLLAYYAEVKGLDMRELAGTSAGELLQVYQALGFTNTVEVRQALSKHFVGLRF